MSGKAVLLLVFNRPGTTRRVLEAVRAARPPRLYVAADGPRAPGGQGAGEEALCRAAREEATAVDWPCEVSTLFRERNLGCKRGVGEALSWFFSREEEGIILEDDCLPAPSFFPFCAELLERYRGESRVMAVSGTDFRFRRGGDPRGPSYLLSRYPHIWGWATWRRAWALYDPDMAGWAEAREERFLRSWLGEVPSRYFTRKLDAAARGEVDSWGYPWMLSCWLNRGLAAVPSVNLVSNLGFGDASTHTRGGSHLAGMARGEIAFPLRPPSSQEPDPAAEARTFSCRYDDRTWPRWRNRAWRLGRLLRKGARSGPA